MRVALYQPDIPQNTGTILRTCACLNVGVDIIQPAGFDMSHRALKRASLDYLHVADWSQHADFNAFRRKLDENGSRLILLSTRGETAYHSFLFHSSDTLTVGRESAGVPDEVHEAAFSRLHIPMQPRLRSLNVAVALAIVLGEALRQTGGFCDFA